MFFNHQLNLAGFLSRTDRDDRSRLKSNDNLVYYYLLCLELERIAFNPEKLSATEMSFHVHYLGFEKFAQPAVQVKIKNGINYNYDLTNRYLNQIFNNDSIPVEIHIALGQLIFPHIFAEKTLLAAGFQTRGKQPISVSEDLVLKIWQRGSKTYDHVGFWAAGIFQPMMVVRSHKREEDLAKPIPNENQVMEFPFKNGELKDRIDKIRKLKAYSEYLKYRETNILSVVFYSDKLYSPLFETETTDYLIRIYYNQADP